MARTLSNMLPLGTEVPDFNLTDSIHGGLVSSNHLKMENGLLVMFICNHCPYVKHVASEFINVANLCIKNCIDVVAISSNDIVKYPEDSPEKMKEIAIQQNYSFPYLFDESQEVARLFDAACTPDFYLFNSNRKLVYRGQFDDSRPQNNIPVTGKDLRDAISALLTGNLVSQDQQPSLGCNIKWKD